MIEEVTNHAALAVARLLVQFQDKPAIVAMLNAYSKQVQDLETALYQLLTQRSLDVAIGAQLDGIGSILKVERGALDDEAYRQRLRVAVSINESSGTAEDLYDMLTHAVPSTIGVAGAWRVRDGSKAEFIVDLIPAAFALYANEAQVIADFVKVARAAGVYAYFTYPSANEGAEQYFSFGPSPDVEGDSFGFNNGAFVGALKV